MQLSEEQILALAPDESSKKAGRDLAQASKWVTRGCSDGALWGECQGSGSKPYQTVMDTQGVAFKCSCPSRKFPCKHGLGLALLYARQSSLFAEGEAPAWAADWLARRATAAEKKTVARDAPVDEAAQGRRREARERKVADGVAELRLWIKDLLRHGILQAPEKGPAFWEGMARRMVDAQAPGLAAGVRALGQTPFYREGWQPGFLEQLTQLYLLSAGYTQMPSLPTHLQQEVRNGIGFPQDQELVKDQPGVTDTWLVLARQLTQEDQLTTERNWLLGTTTGQVALVLQFFVRGQGSGTLSLAPGSYIEAELAFFPAAVPLRALVKRQIAGRERAAQHAFDGWAAVAAHQASVAGQTPFRTQRVVVVDQLTPLPQAGSWWLADAQQHRMPLAAAEPLRWTLMALSGGQPLRMALLETGEGYQPLGLWHQNQYKPL